MAQIPVKGTFRVRRPEIVATSWTATAGSCSRGPFATTGRRPCDDSPRGDRLPQPCGPGRSSFLQRGEPHVWFRAFIIRALQGAPLSYDSLSPLLRAMICSLASRSCDGRPVAAGRKHGRPADPGANRMATAISGHHPRSENSAVSALLDSIVHVARREDLVLQRSPQDESAHPIGQIEEVLLSEGVDVTKPPMADLLASERHETAHQRGGV